MRCTLILNDRVFSTFECPYIWALDVGRGRVRNIAFLDFEIAEIWGRMLFEGATEWEVESREKAGRPLFHYRHTVPGSFLPTRQDCPDFLPLPVLEREFFLHADILKRLPQ